MLHRRFKSELESGVDWSRKSWPSAGETFGRSGSPGAVPLLLCLLVWGFKASETTSRSRLEDAFQEVYMEVYMEGSFTGLTCRRVLCRGNIQMLASPYTLAHSRNHTAWHCDAPQQGPI